MVDHPPHKGRRPAPGQGEPGTEGDEAGAAGADSRVAKALARAGVASRREVERLIGEGRVALNGKVLESPAVKVAPGDVLTVDGAVIGEAEAARVWRHHKPAGLVTTNKDPKGRPTVFEHLPAGLPRVISVGRLDLATEGLLLLTNDGELARALELPSTGWVRRYRARAYGRITQDKLDALKDGITVEGVRYGAIEARLDKARGDDGEGPANLWISLALAEGKNREVRRVLEALGLKVNRLIRLAYGPFALGTLEIGAVEEVGPRVIREQLADLIPPERMPKGDRRPAPMAAAAPPPGRRRRAPASAPRPQGEGAEAPAGRRGSPSKAGAAPAAPEKKTYKAGWARPKPKVKPARPSSSSPKPRKGR